MLPTLEKTRVKEKPSKNRVTLQCQFCGTKFERTIRASTIEVQCPKCHEFDVEIL